MSYKSRSFLAIQHNGDKLLCNGSLSIILCIKVTNDTKHNSTDKIYTLIFHRINNANIQIPVNNKHFSVYSFNGCPDDIVYDNEHTAS